METSELVTQIFAAIGAFVAFATLVVQITPTKKDDTFLAKVKAFFERIGIDLSKAK